jgi:hypothetical protein
MRSKCVACSFNLSHPNRARLRQWIATPCSLTQQVSRRSAATVRVQSPTRRWAPTRISYSLTRNRIRYIDELGITVVARCMCIRLAATDLLALWVRGDCERSPFVPARILPPDFSAFALQLQSCQWEIHLQFRFRQRAKVSWLVLAFPLIHTQVCLDCLYRY